MTSQPKDEAHKPSIVICDSNVIMMMTIFKPTLMFSIQYSFGKIVSPPQGFVTCLDDDASLS